MKSKLINLIALISFITMVAVNYLAVSLPLAGRSTGQISDSYPNLFAPAGYAFSIWAVIYTLLAVYVVYQIKHHSNPLITKINRLFIINALLNFIWIFAWHYDVISLSVLIMLGLLITLIKINNIFHKQALTKPETRFIRLPFSVYFGWITVAMIANITVFLVSIGWNGFGIPESIWTVTILLIGAAIGSWRLLYDRFVPYGLVLVWAYGAILAKHLSTNGFNGKYPSVILTAAFCLMVFTGIIMYLAVKTQKRKNMGTRDRVIRLLFSVFFAVGAFIITPVIFKIVLLILSLFSLFEVIAGWCALNALLGRNTCPIDLKSK